MANIKSFGYALNGLFFFLKTEANAIIHLLAGIAALILCFILHCSLIETVLIIGAAGFVWVAELFNTAIEESMDLISLDKNPQIKIIKDLAAAAVLVAAITALIIGSIIFIPKII
jgi:diacylglycerol kinase (ATP)